MKSREEVEKLKSDWKSDPCWDIEDTEGFEEYHDELAGFSDVCNREWKQKAKEKQESDPLYQAKERIKRAGQAVGDGSVEFVNGMTLRAMTYALIAIAEELRHANGNQ
jgi:hypothetical protein